MYPNMMFDVTLILKEGGYKMHLYLYFLTALSNLAKLSKYCVILRGSYLYNVHPHASLVSCSSTSLMTSLACMLYFGMPGNIDL